jgi:hypothetical protein
MRNKKPENGLREFKDALSDFRELTALAVKGTIAVPLVALVLKFGPPPSGEVCVLTSGAVFLSMIWTFQFWRNLSEKCLRFRMKSAVLIFCITLSTSGILLATRTLRPGPNRDRIVLGYKLRPDYKRLVSAPPTPMEALEEAEYDPYRIWTSSSIVVVETALIASWVIAFTAAGMFVSAFAILQRRRRFNESVKTIQ